MISCIWTSDWNEFFVFDARTSESYLTSGEKGQIVTQTRFSGLSRNYWSNSYNCDNTLPSCFNPQYSRHIYKYTYAGIHEFHVWELQIERNEKFIGFLAFKVALKNCQELTHSHIEIMSACFPYYLSTYSQSNLLKNKRAALLLLFNYFKQGSKV